MCDFSETPYRNDEAAGWLLSPVHRRLDCVAIHQTSHIVPIHRDWGLDLFSLSIELIIVTLLLLAAWRTRQKASRDTNRKSRVCNFNIFQNSRPTVYRRRNCRNVHALVAWRVNRQSLKNMQRIILTLKTIQQFRIIN